MSQTRPAVPRLALLAILVLVVTGAVGAVAFSADPDAGSVSVDSPQTGWNGESYAVGTSKDPAICDAGPLVCDRFDLTVDIPASHWDSNRGGVEVNIAWEDDADDFDMYVYDAAGDEVASSAVGGTSGERVMIENASREAGPYEVVVNPWQVTDSDYQGGALVSSRAEVAAGAGDVPTEPVSDVPCVDGMAGPFPCRDVDLEGFIPVPGLNDGVAEDREGDPVALNDIWGWTDPETGREYAIVGKTTGTAFVDVTDPRAPRYLGSLQTAAPLTETLFKTWRDIKVYEDHAFIVSEEPTHGMQVFDLTRLRGVTEPQAFDSDADYNEFGNAHNIAINEDSGFAYAIGTSTCNRGAHIVNIQDPTSPTFAGCDGADGYVHDTQCVIYDGPDTEFTGREICLSSNEDTLTITDVTDEVAGIKVPVALSRLPYDGSAYTHQGWLTSDGKHFLVNDELDEQTNDVPTTTRIFNVESLRQPALVGEYEAAVGSIDHNLYTKGDAVFEANYRSGLRILNASRAAEGVLTEEGFFDVFPDDDEPEFNGAWSNYPYFDSGIVVVSGIEQGLFVLRPRTASAPAVTAPGGQPAAPPPSSPPPASPGPAASPPAGAGAGAASAPAPSSASCIASGGFRSVAVDRRGSGLRLGFERRATRRVDVDVFQQSVGRRITGERLVARFSGRDGSVAWNGRANRRGRSVTDGYYFVRYTMRTPEGTDVRRVALRRVNGRWSSRPSFYRRATCDLLSSFKTERPVFGGRTNRALNASYRLTQDARVTVTVSRGSRVVRRYATTARPADRTHRLRLGAGGLPRGDYRVRITVRRGTQTLTSTLVSRRL